VKSFIKKIGYVVLLFLFLSAGWLLLAPTDVHPIGWSAPAAPSLRSGRYAEHSRFASPARLGQGLNLKGPETVLPDAQGRLLCGLEDGRIVRLTLQNPPQSPPQVETLVNTGGRPLGLAWHPNGNLIVADAKLGLLAVDLASRRVSTLTHSVNGQPFGYTDNVAISADGRFAYFSDATEKWHYGQDAEAIIEHGGDGRLLRYDFAARATKVLASGLQFANGVALGPDEAYALVNETGAYRISRYWLKGEHAGTTDIFIDNLPGLPDNVTFNGRNTFWVAIYTPRNPLLDNLSEWPFVRRMVARALQVVPAPIEHRAMVLGFDPSGNVLATLHIAGPHNYAPLTNVVESGDWLIFGSLTQDGIARYPLNDALPPR
jgi:sugar lactone lactonase YvrE